MSAAKVLIAGLLIYLAASVPMLAIESAVGQDVALKKEPTEKNQVPSYLLQATHTGLDLVNLLNRMDGPRSQETAQLIIEKLPQLKAEARKQGLPRFMVDVLQSHLGNLPHTIADGEFYEAVVMTNQLTSVLGAMVAYYEPRIPFILGRMDYLLRDVYIHANFGDFTYAAERLEDIRAEWKGGLLEDVKAHGGSELIRQFDQGAASLDGLIQKKTVPQIKSKSEDLQKLVHEMQDLYRM